MRFAVGHRVEHRTANHPADPAQPVLDLRDQSFTVGGAGHACGYSTVSTTGSQTSG